jgi:hypothetical protein
MADDNPTVAAEIAAREEALARHRAAALGRNPLAGPNQWSRLRAAVPIAQPAPPEPTERQKIEAWAHDQALAERRLMIDQFVAQSPRGSFQSDYDPYNRR